MSARRFLATFFRGRRLYIPLLLLLLAATLWGPITLPAPNTRQRRASGSISLPLITSLTPTRRPAILSPRAAAGRQACTASPDRLLRCRDFEEHHRCPVSSLATLRRTA